MWILLPIHRRCHLYLSIIYLCIEIIMKYTYLPTVYTFDFVSVVKVEKILKGSLDLMQSPSVKIQIIAGKIHLRCKGKTLLGVVNKLFVFKSLLTTTSNVLPLHLKQTFPPIIWIVTEGEGNGIESSISFKILWSPSVSSLLLRVHCQIFWEKSLTFKDRDSSSCAKTNVI